ncbi:hypothetical protein NQ315_012380 [Exocentrus adspersus]|uniref:GIY-YIG homing endonuclease n=1 Tax=Exocentrus adspersus TaxID=1586481 RepID=A0AAV8VMP9_9CUCU|nr:hypothetical protein NQ315_012380 [Exocentrus adspersus]
MIFLFSKLMLRGNPEGLYQKKSTWHSLEGKENDRKLNAWKRKETLGTLYKTDIPFHTLCPFQASIGTCQRIIRQIFGSHQIRFNRKATVIEINNCEMNYSKEELVNMVYAIGEAHGNCLLASRIYQANNPDLQRYPLTKCFVKLKERFERTANANYEKTARTHACSNQDRQIDIVGCAIQNPSTSIREISDEISISKSVVHRTLKKNNFHPYHPEHHQFLTEQDCQKRVLFTDESSFANTGRENRHNYHHYADQNPRLMRQDDHQHRFKVNVWAGK